MWESRRDFQGLREEWEAGFLAFHAFLSPSFPQLSSILGLTCACCFFGSCARTAGTPFRHCQRLPEISKKILNASGDAAVTLDLASPLSLLCILSQGQFEAVAFSQARCVGRCCDKFCAS
jgi:hypothetical protein